MNIALRKLAMLEKTLAEKEETARVQGYVTSTVDKDFHRRISDLMDRVRVI